MLETTLNKKIKEFIKKIQEHFIPDAIFVKYYLHQMEDVFVVQVDYPLAETQWNYRIILPSGGDLDLFFSHEYEFLCQDIQERINLTASRYYKETENETRN
jgi:hypothetical protein